MIRTPASAGFWGFGLLRTTACLTVTFIFVSIFVGQAGHAGEIMGDVKDIKEGMKLATKCNYDAREDDISEAEASVKKTLENLRDEHIPVPLTVIASQAGGLETPQREQDENASNCCMGDIYVHC